MEEDDDRVNVVLVDNDLDEHGGAELKSSFVIQGTNLGGGEQDPNLIDEILGGNALIVQCDLAQVVHGSIREGGSPATLAVFQFAFVPRGNNRRFKEVEITITFSAGELQKIAPDNVWATLPSETQQELSHTISPALEAAFGPAKATLGYAWQLTNTTTKVEHARIEGSMMVQGQWGGGRRKKNTAFWGLYENKQTRSGIPSFLQTAVLLKREKTEKDPLGEKFGAEITIKGEVDRHTYFKDRLESIGKKMSGKSRKGKDVIFSPDASRGSVKDVNNLMSEDLGAYNRLVTMPQWVDGSEKPPEQKPSLLEATHMEPASQPPPKLAAVSAADSTASTAPVVDAPVHHPAETDTRPLDSRVPSLEHHQAVLAKPTTLASENPIPSAMVEAPSTVPGHEMPETSAMVEAPSTAPGHERPETSATITKRESADGNLAELREQLSMVRLEAKLVNRLIGLVEEEKRLLLKIKRLERHELMGVQ